MGVHGLWNLLDPAGKPVSLESLQNKVLAVDVSIWLNQAVKGFRDAHGNPLPNAHLLGLFHRVCKLLFYGIRPVFVFDGGVPYLKKQTLMARRQQKSKAARKADKIKEQLLTNLLKHNAVKKAIGGKIPTEVLKRITTSNTKDDDDMFDLPAVRPSSSSQEDEQELDEELSGAESDVDILSHEKWVTDLHSVDVTSDEFKSLPASVKHDILTELKETRKQSSWGRMYEMPQESNDFSGFQMKRLLKRRAVQVCLEEVEQEIGDRTLKLSDLEKMLSESGVLENSNVGRRIASDDRTRYVLVKADANASDTSSQERARENKVNPPTTELNASQTSDHEAMSGDEAEAIAGKLEKKDVSDASSESEEESLMDLVRRYKDRASSKSGLLLAKKCAQVEGGGLSQEEILATIQQSHQSKEPSDDVEDDLEKPGCSKSLETNMVQSTNSKLPIEINDSNSEVKEPKNVETATAVIKEDDGATATVRRKLVSADDSKIDFSDAEENSENSRPVVSPIQKGVTNGRKRKMDSSKSLQRHKNKRIMLQVQNKDKQAEKSASKNNTLEAEEVGKRSVHKFMDVEDEVRSEQQNGTKTKTLRTYCLCGEERTFAHPNERIVNEESDSESDLVEIVPGEESVSAKEIDNPQVTVISGSDNANQVRTTTYEKEPFHDNKSKQASNINKTNKNSSKEALNLEIVIDPAKLSKDTDDIFADVFSKDNKLKKQVVSDSNYEESEEKKKASLEIVIDPSKTYEDKDDIFADVFSSESESEMKKTVNNRQNHVNTEKKSPGLEIVIDPTKISDDKDDIFADVFSDVSNVNDTKAKPNTNGTPSDEHLKMIEITEDSCDVSDVSRVAVTPEKKKVERASDTGVIQEKENGSAEEESDDDDDGAKRSEHTRELLSVQSLLEKEADNLVTEKGKQERLAATITDQMYVEAQELLQLFGIPYIIAPMEAEAQCAFLDYFSLTHGTITDDSDIWLFGGQRVYKNFFNQTKFVKFFQAADIQRYFNLTRNHMILLALLVGSDYTVGIQGVGPVTAMEVLAEFPPKIGEGVSMEELLSGLIAFREWWEKKKQSIKTALRNKLKEIELHPGFPSPTVVDAYLHPVVDESKENFSWAPPDLDALRQFARKKFGWLQPKSDEILLPVMKKVNERTTQMKLDAYYQVKLPQSAPPQERLSQRVQRAVQRVGNPGRSEEEQEEEEEEEEREPTAAPPKRTTRGGGGGGNSSGTTRGRGRGRGTVQSIVKEVRSRERPVRRERPTPEEDRTSLPGPERKRGGKIVTLRERQVDEFIPQREKDKVNSLKRKLQAIEIFQKSDKRGRGKGKQRKVVRKEMKEANLSESSESD